MPSHCSSDGVRGGTRASEITRVAEFLDVAEAGQGVGRPVGGEARLVVEPAGAGVLDQGPQHDAPVSGGPPRPAPVSARPAPVDRCAGATYSVYSSPVSPASPAGVSAPGVAPAPPDPPDPKEAAEAMIRSGP